MLPRLDRLTVKGFKTLVDAEIELRPLTVIIGANGAGKSNLVQALQLLEAVRKEGRLASFIDSLGGAGSVLHQGPKVTSQIEVCVDFRRPDGQGMWYRSTLSFAPPDRLVFSKDEIGREGCAGPFGVSVPGEFATSILEETFQTLGAPFTGAPHVCNYHFQDTTPQAPVKLHADEANNELLTENGGNAAAVLLRIQQEQPATYQSLLQTIRLAAPFFGDFFLKPTAQGRILLRWTQHGSDEIWGPHVLSDGTLRFILLVTALMQPTVPQVLVIDEPELGLHPAAIGLLAELMESCSQRCQVVATTQSVTLLDQLEDPESVVVVDRQGAASTFKRLNAKELEEWLAGYSLGDLWLKNVLGGRPHP